MVSTIRSRPSHYETLGLKPTANGEEIARAFVKEFSRPHAFGGGAEVSVAFATLRDPIKRRAYDASLGLKPEPALSYSLTAWAAGAPFIGSAPGGPLGRYYKDGSPTPAPRANPPGQPEPPAEPRMASFIAASLRDPAKPEARHEPPPASKLQPPEPLRRPQAEASSRRDPHIGGDRVLRRAEDGRLSDAEDGSIEWKRTAIAAGVLVVAVAFLGAWAGLEAGNGPGPPQPEHDVKIALPPAQPPPTAAAPSPAPVRGLEEVRPARPMHRAVAVAQAVRTVTTPRPAPTEGQQAEVTQSAQSQPQQDAAEQAVAESSPVAPVAANLPLPNAVIARTIERIGYACGRVASTTAPEGGAPGVFRVTCTSGNSYQASPVRGRYHFRRVGSH